MQSRYNPRGQFVRIWDIPPHTKGLMDEKMRIVKQLNIRTIRRGKNNKYDYVTQEDAMKLHPHFKDLGSMLAASPLLGITDQGLVDELRRRGYQVKATKTTTIEL